MKTFGLAELLLLSASNFFQTCFFYRRLENRCELLCKCFITRGHRIRLMKILLGHSARRLLTFTDRHFFPLLLYDSHLSSQLTISFNLKSFLNHWRGILQRSTHISCYLVSLWGSYCSTSSLFSSATKCQLDACYKAPIFKGILKKIQVVFFRTNLKLLFVSGFKIKMVYS